MELLNLGARKAWMAPEIVQIGRLPMRATLTPYTDRESAQSNDRTRSPWLQVLSGDTKTTVIGWLEVWFRVSTRQ